MNNFLDKNLTNIRLIQNKRKLSDAKPPLQEKDKIIPFIHYEDEFEKQQSREMLLSFLVDRFTLLDSFEIKEDRFADFQELVDVIVLNFNRSQTVEEFCQLIKIVSQVFTTTEAGKPVYLKHHLADKSRDVLQKYEYWQLLFDYIQAKTFDEKAKVIQEQSEECNENSQFSLIKTFKSMFSIQKENSTPLKEIKYLVLIDVNKMLLDMEFDTKVSQQLILELAEAKEIAQAHLNCLLQTYESNKNEDLRKMVQQPKFKSQDYAAKKYALLTAADNKS